MKNIHNIFTILSTDNCFVLPDCIVRQSLNYETSNIETVNFNALIRPNKTIFEAELSCEAKYWIYDTLIVTNDTVTKNRRTVMTDKEEYKSPGTSEGWGNFTLIVASEGYQLKDSRGRFWIPEEDTSKCKVGKVAIRKGVLMGGCSEGSPIWKVSGDKCVEVPLPKPEPGWVVDLSLYSSISFSPSFQVGQSEFMLSWQNNDLAVVTGNNPRPLPPSRAHRFTLDLSLPNEKATIKVMFTCYYRAHNSHLVSPLRILYYNVHTLINND